MVKAVKYPFVVNIFRYINLKRIILISALTIDYLVHKNGKMRQEVEINLQVRTS